MLSVVAIRYAHALVDVALAPGSGLEARNIGTQLRSVEELLRQSADLRHVLLSPAVPASRKRAVLGQFTSELGVAPKVRNFLYVLIDHRRIHKLPEMREAYEAALDERLGFIRADIASAQPLSEDQRVELQSELAKLAGKKVRMEYAVDATLVGGVSARIGSTIYDGSVRGQLDALRRRLASE